jgi:hypothetical protein
MPGAAEALLPPGFALGEGEVGGHLSRRVMMMMMNDDDDDDDDDDDANGDGFHLVGQRGRPLQYNHNSFWNLWLGGRPCPDAEKNKAIIWRLQPNERLQVSKTLCKSAREKMVKEIVHLFERLRAIKAEKRELEQQSTISAINAGKKVIGCTTSGASIHR